MPHAHAAPLAAVLRALVVALSAAPCGGLSDNLWSRGGVAQLRARSWGHGAALDRINEAEVEAAARPGPGPHPHAHARAHQQPDQPASVLSYIPNGTDGTNGTHGAAKGINTANGTDGTAKGTSGANDNNNVSLQVVTGGHRTIFSDRDSCTGCDFTVDLRCGGTRIHRFAAFHRINDCVVPMYNMIELARMASENKSAHVCALTWHDDKHMDIQELLNNIVGFKWHSLVSEDDSCAGSLQYHASFRPWVLGATTDYLRNFGRDHNMLSAYEIDIQANLGWLHRDVSAFVGDAPPWLVIINRQHETRAFKQKDFEMLLQTMKKDLKINEQPLEAKVYVGTETLLDTVRTFTNAAVVVGYHGAAWANTLFTPRTHCSHQITTWEDLQDRVRWRVNWQVEVNKLGKFNVYTIPLRTMLEANKVPVATYEKLQDKDHFIKDLPWVPLQQTDADNLAESAQTCIKTWVMGDHASRDSSPGPRRAIDVDVD